jgi:hypothetical protein
MRYFSLKSCPITPPPSAAAVAASPVPCPRLHRRRVTLAFAPPSCLPWLVVASPIVVPFLSRRCLLTRSLHLSPLVLPGWLSSHFSLHHLRLTLPLAALPPLIDAPAGCCVASHCAASSSCQLSSRHRLSRHASWLSRRLLSYRPLVRVSKGRLTMRRRLRPH